MERKAGGAVGPSSLYERTGKKTTCNTCYFNLVSLISKNYNTYSNQMLICQSYVPSTLSTTTPSCRA